MPRRKTVYYIEFENIRGITKKAGEGAYIGFKHPFHKFRDEFSADKFAEKMRQEPDYFRNIRIKKMMI